MKNKRPTIITLLCIIELVGFPFALIDAFLPAVAALGQWYRWEILISAFAGLVPLYGLWNMKRWSVFAYAGLSVLINILLLVLGDWSPVVVITQGVVLAIMVWKYPLMS